MTATSLPAQLSDLSAVEALRLFSHRDLSPVELTQDCLTRIGRDNPSVNAFAHVDEARAMAAARASEARWQAGEPCGP